MDLKRCGFYIINFLDLLAIYLIIVATIISLTYRWDYFIPLCEVGLLIVGLIDLLVSKPIYNKHIIHLVNKKAILFWAVYILCSTLLIIFCILLFVTPRG
jgi:hypothetical protein